MHFWIDKRSQCGYGGRYRVPSSLSSGLGRGRGRLGAPKIMVAPVHRFATIDPPPRRVTRQYRTQYVTPAQALPPVHACRRADDTIFVELGEGGSGRAVTPDTLLRTAALGLHHWPVIAPHLKFGMLASFALATIFLAGAKFYFDRQVMRDSVEAGALCLGVGAVFGLGCALTAWGRRPPRAPPLALTTVPRTQTARDLSPDLDVAGGGGAGAGGGAGGSPPPPYHIAVLLPRREPDPPAYCAAR